MGIILIGAQIARYLKHVRVRTFSLMLGIFAVLLAAAFAVGTDFPIFPVLLILIGISIVMPRRFGGERA